MQTIHTIILYVNLSIDLIPSPGEVNKTLHGQKCNVGLGIGKDGLTIKMCNFIHWSVVVPIALYGSELWILMIIQATLLNPDMCYPDFRLNRTDLKVPVPSYTYNSYTHNSDFA